MLPQPRIDAKSHIGVIAEMMWGDLRARSEIIGVDSLEDGNL